MTTLATLRALYGDERVRRWLATGPRGRPVTCVVCGASITQPWRGRPKLYCRWKCRNKAPKRRTDRAE